MSRSPKRGRRAPLAGDLVAVRLRDDLYGLLQLGWVFAGSPGVWWLTCGLFPHAAASAEALALLATPDTLRDPFAIVTAWDPFLDRGRWPMIGNSPVDYVGAEDIPGRIRMPDWNWLDGEQHASAHILSIWHGMTHWDHQFKTGYMERLLRPGHRRPPQSWLKADGPPAGLRLPPPPVPLTGKAFRPRPGPAVIEVSLSYPDAGLPNAEQLAIRQRVEDFILEREFGPVTDAGAGGGSMDLVVEALDGPAAVAALKDHLLATVGKKGWEIRKG